MSVHVFYGYSRREAEPDDECLYCDSHEDVMAYTYFGAPVCERCWEVHWRTSEDGACDPPFDEITHRVSGEWLTASNTERKPDVEA